MGNANLVRDFDLNAIGPDFIDNPHPVLDCLRTHSPIHRNPDGSLFLTRFADVQQVYQDRTMKSEKTQAFAAKFGDTPLYQHHTTSLVFNDPPYHTIVRKLLASAFTPRKLAEMEPLIGVIVDRLLDEIEEMREFDFVKDFAMRLPTEIISFMLGIPQEYRTRLRAFSLSVLGALDPVVPEEKLKLGNESVAEFGALLDELINHRRKNPDGAAQGEVLEALIFGEQDGRKLTQTELIQNCIFLLNAGHETTTSLVSNGLGMLLTAPDQYRLLREEPEHIETAVEEILRYESPLQIGNRETTVETEIGGVKIPAGTYIHTSIAAANRDPEVFTQPHRIDITRRPNRHLAFITGIHVCLGATLARFEGRIAFGRLVKRFPDIESTTRPVRMPLARFRGYNSMPVRIGRPR